MSQPNDNMLPPSYEEAVYGVPPAEAPKDSLPVTNTPIHAPQPSASQVAFHPSQSPTVHYNSQQYMPYPYSVCPPGAEPLLNLHEILVYPSKGWKYKIKDHNKAPVMTAKLKWDGDCCDSCSCDRTKRFILQSLDGRGDVAEAHCVIDSINFCSYSPQHLEVRTASNAFLGVVQVKSQNKCTVVNQSGDLLFTLKRERDWFQNLPYQIFSGNGREVGRIDNTRGIKNRLTVHRDMPINHKILLLFFSVFLQCEDDSRRRNS